MLKWGMIKYINSGISFDGCCFVTVLLSGRIAKDQSAREKGDTIKQKVLPGFACFVR